MNFGLWHSSTFTAENKMDSDIQIRRRSDRGSLKRYSNSLKYDVVETDFPENIDEKKLFIFFEEEEGTTSAHDNQFDLNFLFFCNNNLATRVNDLGRRRSTVS